MVVHGVPTSALGADCQTHLTNVPPGRLVWQSAPERLARGRRSTPPSSRPAGPLSTGQGPSSHVALHHPPPDLSTSVVPAPTRPVYETEGPRLARVSMHLCSEARARILF